MFKQNNMQKELTNMILKYDFLLLDHGTFIYFFSVLYIDKVHGK